MDFASDNTVGASQALLAAIVAANEGLVGRRLAYLIRPAITWVI
jgi:hypothetical protein